MFSRDLTRKLWSTRLESLLCGPNPSRKLPNFFLGRQPKKLFFQYYPNTETKNGLGHPPFRRVYSTEGFFIQPTKLVKPKRTPTFYEAAVVQLY